MSFRVTSKSSSNVSMVVLNQAVTMDIQIREGLGRIRRRERQVDVQLAIPKSQFAEGIDEDR